MTGFGKLFSGLYEGSMLGAGVHVFALWPYCIARSDATGHVEVNPRLAAVVLGCSIPEVEAALEYLQRPDPESRSKGEDGRRLIREGQFAYRIVNYAKYREARDAEARREYRREWDREHRPSGHARTGSPTQSDTVRHSPTNPTKAEAEAEAEAEARERTGAIAPEPPACAPSRKRFIPPTLIEWETYCRKTWPDWTPNDIGGAWGYYEARGWKTIKNWQAAARTCAARREGAKPSKQAQGVLVGAHPDAKPVRDISTAPDDIRDIARRIFDREPTTEAEDDRYAEWLRGAA